MTYNFTQRANKDICPQKCLHMNVHIAFFRNNLKPEIMQISIKKDMNKLWYIHTIEQEKIKKLSTKWINAIKWVNLEANEASPKKILYKIDPV